MYRVQTTQCTDTSMRACGRVRFNPFNPHDALKHNFWSLKNDLISNTWGDLDNIFLELPK